MNSIRIILFLLVFLSSTGLHAQNAQECEDTCRHIHGDHNLLGLLDDYKVMIAQYTRQEPILKDDLDFVIWQYTGKGHLNGINGYVDKSRFMGQHRLREIRFRHR